MNYLCIDTSGKNLTLLIKKGQEYFSFHDENCGVSHSVRIMPEIENLIEKANFDLKSADFIACVVGAGSFTGIRIGVATAKGLAFANDLKVLSITSFDTLAYNENEKKTLAVIDAKHNGYYVCGYENKKVIYPPKYILKEQLNEIKKDYKLVSFEEIDGLEIEKVDIVSGLKLAVEDKASLATKDVNALAPLYCRKSQAEENR